MSEVFFVLRICILNFGFVSDLGFSTSDFLGFRISITTTPLIISIMIIKKIYTVCLTAVAAKPHRVGRVCKMNFSHADNSV